MKPLFLKITKEEFEIYFSERFSIKDIEFPIEFVLQKDNYNSIISRRLEIRKNKLSKI